MFTTREEWLIAAVERLRPMFATADAPITDPVRVSCGWPLGSRTAVGQAFSIEASADKAAEIFIAPSDDNPVEVLTTLVHELVHVVCPGDGHRGRFPKVAKAVGLLKPMRTTPASPELKRQLEQLAGELGKYPHARLSAEALGRKVQGTRMLKLECPCCSYAVRTTKRWIELGLPMCPAGTQMQLVVDDGESGDDEQL